MQTTSGRCLCDTCTFLWSQPKEPKLTCDEVLDEVYQPSANVLAVSNHNGSRSRRFRDANQLSIYTFHHGLIDYLYAWDAQRARRRIRRGVETSLPATVGGRSAPGPDAPVAGPSGSAGGGGDPASANPVCGGASQSANHTDAQLTSAATHSGSPSTVSEVCGMQF